ncbi:hypothetical protein OEA41_002756 [Lepraria neglecta]|uniref:Transcription elongation factor Eaf N-terminal domain-containing protein n=1 Tax=Lepraria neglecta TaxID=209136 RepID=A0AAD9Z3C2_9LECA|nr:hypothetical protein OEA41_002756 [Lepraria neglecta]
MAATIASLPIDPSKTARCPVTISEQLLREDGPRKRRRVNVQLNHRPKVPTSLTKSTITPSLGSSQSYNLYLTNTTNNESFHYKGTQQPSTSTALIYDQTTQSFTLSKIDTEFRFNLTSTPSNKDAASLATQYPQLETTLAVSNHEEDDLFDDNAEDQDPDTQPPDPNNPYDYRHFLHRARAAHSPSPAPSQLSSPIPNHNLNSPAFTASSAARPSRPAKPRHRSSHSQPRYLSPNPREEVADVDNEASDNYVLTIDMGDSITNTRPWRSVLGALNEGGRSSGPISLRSAASSMSPSLRGDSDDDEEEEREEAKSNADVEEIDLGDGHVSEESEEGGEEEVDGDGDVAVETPGGGWEDGNGELEAEFEQALMSEAEQDRANGNGRINGMNGVEPERERVVEESSEESEEE